MLKPIVSEALPADRSATVITTSATIRRVSRIPRRGVTALSRALEAGDVLVENRHQPFDLLARRIIPSVTDFASVPSTPTSRTVLT